MTNYQLAGKGKLVLILHGWGDSLQGLQDLAADLSKNYQVLSIDLPGFGATQAPKEVWNLDNYAEFVTAALQKLELDQPYAVLGHSNGGALAIRSISLDKLRPEKLVLLAASGIRSRGGLKRLLLKILAKTGNIATLWMPERYRQALRKSLYGSVGSDMLVAPHLTETFKKTVRQDVQKDAATVTVPTLLIYADQDADVPVADGHKYKGLIKNSQLEVIEGAGHFVHHDQPQAVTKLVQEFLK